VSTDVRGETTLARFSRTRRVRVSTDVRGETTLAWFSRTRRVRVSTDVRGETTLAWFSRARRVQVSTDVGRGATLAWFSRARRVRVSTDVRVQRTLPPGRVEGAWSLPPFSPILAAEPMATPPKKQILDELRALLTYIPKYYAGRALVLSGQTYTAAEAVALVAENIAVYAAVDAALAGVKAAALKRETFLASGGKVVADMRRLFQIEQNKVPVALAELQIKPRRVYPKLSTEAQLTKEAKASSTRLARRTKSKKQKSKIFGDVTGVKITPRTRGDE
jgi:hypothetical protein